MSTVEELGYDPNEWEECPAPDHFLAFGLFTRILLSLFAILFCILFFWTLEIKKNREKRNLEDTAKEKQREVKRLIEEEPVDLDRIVEETIFKERSRTSTPNRRLSSKKPLTADEQNALLDWERELREVGERRLRASEEPESYTDTENLNTDGNLALPSNAFDNLTLLNDLEPNLKDVQRVRLTDSSLCATPPSTPENLISTSNNKLGQQMAADLQKKLMAETNDELQKLDQNDPCPIGKEDQRVFKNPLFEGKDDRLDSSPTVEEAKIQSKQLFGGPSNNSQNQLNRAWFEAQEALSRQQPWNDPSQQEKDSPPQKAYPGTPSDIELNKPWSEIPAWERFEEETFQKDQQQIENPPQFKKPSNFKEVPQKKESSSSEEGFVKIYQDTEELQQLPGEEQSRDRRSKFNQKHNTFLVRSLAVDEPAELLRETDSSPERKSFHLQVHAGTSSTSPSTIEDWSERDSAPGVQFRAAVDDIDESGVPADDIEFVQNVELPQNSSVYDIQKQQSSTPYNPDFFFQPVEETNSFNEQPNIVVTIPDQLDTTNIDGLKQRGGQLSPDLEVRKPAQKELDNEEAQVMKLLQEYDDFGVVINSNSGEKTHFDSSRNLSPRLRGVRNENAPSPDLGLFEDDDDDDDKSPYDLANEETIEVQKSQQQQKQQFHHSIEGGRDERKWRDLNEEASKPYPIRNIRPTTTLAPQTKWGSKWTQPINREEEFQQETKTMKRKISADEERKKTEHLVQAEMFLQDAMDFMDNQASPAPSTAGLRTNTLRSTAGGGNGFIMEEEMLESDDKQPHMMEYSKPLQLAPKEDLKTRPAANSAEPTSRQITTNEVFEKPEILPAIFDDADDAITYAPEIQSVEIPPDQLSQNSLNLIENFSEHQDLLMSQNEGIAPFEKAPPLHLSAPAIDLEPIPLKETLIELKLKEDETSPSPSFKKPKAPNFLAQKASTVTPLVVGANTTRMIPTKKRALGAPKAPQFARRFGMPDEVSTSSISTSSRSFNKQSSLLSALGVTSMQEMLLKLTTLDEFSVAMRKAGLESTNLIFGIDYTASNKYQGEHSFQGRSLHSVDRNAQLENPYQQTIKIMGQTLAPFANKSRETGIPVYGFGDATTGDWSVFALNGDVDSDQPCRDLDEVLRVYNEITPHVDLSGPTNFAPLIFRAMQICQQVQDYHILVIIADGQVTNERATRKAIVQACQFPLSIIVVGVGDGPWDMMKVFDESLPKRPWDNFHFVEFNEIFNAESYEDSTNPSSSTTISQKQLAFAVQTLLEVPDQYHHIRKLGMLPQRE